MRRFFITFGVATALCATVGYGQLTVQVRMQQDTVLVYESIHVTVNVNNFSGRMIELKPGAEKPWLNFIVQDENGSLVRAVGESLSEGETLIPPGQTVARTIDLLPLYDLRVRGNYRVQARIMAGAAMFESTPARFTIVNGRDLATLTVGLPPRGSEPDDYRTYTLCVKQGPERGAKLYLGVRDNVHQLVYGMLPLGNYVPLVEPELRTDKEGDVHVLFQSGPRAFGYAHVTSSGKMLTRAVYSDMLSRPQLVTQEGVITVRGGEQTWPRVERMMTEEEINPPPPPPKPKKKKHWWSSTPKEDQTTNQPSANAPAASGQK